MICFSEESPVDSGDWPKERNRAEMFTLRMIAVPPWNTWWKDFGILWANTFLKKNSGSFGGRKSVRGFRFPQARLMENLLSFGCLTFGLFNLEGFVILSKSFRRLLTILFDAAEFNFSFFSASVMNSFPVFGERWNDGESRRKQFSDNYL